MNTKTYPCNYRAAVRWLNGDIIQFNNIFDFDDDLWYRNYQLDEKAEDYKEIYQYYLTDYSEDDVDFLIEHFDLSFAYSEKLDLWILLVTHFGTSWDYVYWTTDLEGAACGLGEDPRPF